MMAPNKGIKHSCQTLPPDLLSNLPNDALDCILVRLPLREAVRTSILSKKWRYTWCRLPEVTLDETLWKTPDDTGPVTKFTLSISILVGCPNVDNLIYFLSRDAIQDLVLRLPKPEDNLYKLPSSLFTCLQLRRLTLESSVRFLCLKNIPLLAKISLMDDEGRCDIVKFFQSLSTIEHLHLEYMDQLKTYQQGFPLILTVSNIVPYAFFLCFLDEVLCALCLIRSFPYLQYLKIEIIDVNYEDIPALECLEVEHFSDVTFNHLREVRLIMGTGSKPEMQLIKLLLAKSPVLVRMLIEAGMFEESATVQMLVEFLTIDALAVCSKHQW
ncbi:hypothetical protein RND71_040103 [Anisodus tanguticus]|uniref:F-box domain-containing protein n=1 Tax=Anisodus tanguticus TaxID=243964 RepID=A0AAE1USL0_9SOLA|nr:hypothetical protein RND71_040103 [Anisodus tanguticus]